MPQVLNRRTDKIPAGAIYVGRPSKWGNPFRLNDPLLYGLPKEEKRRLVINEYRKWLQGESCLVKEFGEPPSLSELTAKDLVCWCAPLPCHADVLLELANMESEKWRDGADMVCSICKESITKGQPFNATISHSPKKRECSHYFCKGGTMTIIGSPEPGVIEATQYGGRQ